MKLYSKTGDDGRTGLIGGQRIPKDDHRVACYGEVDELNAVVGLAAAASPDDERRDLHEIQSGLFVLGTQLATAEEGKPSHSIDAARVAALEERIDAITTGLEPLRSFVLPGGCELAARFHHARTICRRAERAVVALARGSTVDPLAIVYLNRLGDLLFALALSANQQAGTDDVTWNAR